MSAQDPDVSTRCPHCRHLAESPIEGGRTFTLILHGAEPGKCRQVTWTMLPEMLEAVRNGKKSWLDVYAEAAMRAMVAQLRET